MAKSERIALYFSGEEELKIYKFLKGTKNASALVRYLTKLYMDGYIPNPTGVVFGTPVRTQEQYILTTPTPAVIPNPIPVQNSTLPSEIIQKKMNEGEIENKLSKEDDEKVESKLSKGIEKVEEVNEEEVDYLKGILGGDGAGGL